MHTVCVCVCVCACVRECALVRVCEYVCVCLQMFLLVEGRFCSNMPRGSCESSDSISWFQPQEEHTSDSSGSESPWTK